MKRGLNSTNHESSLLLGIGLQKAEQERRSLVAAQADQAYTPVPFYTRSNGEAVYPLQALEEARGRFEERQKSSLSDTAQEFFSPSLSVAAFTLGSMNEWTATTVSAALGVYSFLVCLGKQNTIKHDIAEIDRVEDYVRRVERLQGYSSKEKDAKIHNALGWLNFQLAAQQKENNNVVKFENYQSDHNSYQSAYRMQSRLELGAEYNNPEKPENHKDPCLLVLSVKEACAGSAEAILHPIIWCKDIGLGLKAAGSLAKHGLEGRAHSVKRAWDQSAFEKFRTKTKAWAAYRYKDSHISQFKKAANDDSADGIDANALSPKDVDRQVRLEEALKKDWNSVALCASAAVADLALFVVEVGQAVSSFSTNDIAKGCLHTAAAALSLGAPRGLLNHVRDKSDEIGSELARSVAKAAKQKPESHDELDSSVPTVG